VAGEVLPADLLARQRPAEMEALPLVAAQVLQQVRLRLLLDALGHDAKPEAVGEAHDRLHDGGVAPAAGEVADEGAVDLDAVQVELLHVFQRRVAHAEVVEHGAGCRGRRSAAGVAAPSPGS